MGKWKYLNWLVILVILFFMFGTLSGRYQAGVATYLCVISAMVILTLTGYYIFVVKIEQKKIPGKHTDQKPKSVTILKERPKVVLNRGSNYKELNNEK